MKTKLLKKVRKRYDILYYPDGYVYDGIRFKGVKYELVDNHASEFLSTERYHKTYESAYKALVNKIRKAYGKKKKPKTNAVKVWWNQNK